MKYIITANYEDTTSTIETNDIETLFQELWNRLSAPHLCVGDGTTGEVLMHTGSEPYFAPGFMMLWMKWMLPQFYD